jgi:hypothetical protein
MKTINSTRELAEAISLLETRQAEQGILLREQFHLTYDSLKPLNLIKSTLREAAISGELKDNIMNTSVGLAAGYISKKVFEGVSNNPLKKLLGSALMFVITNIVTRNPETIKFLGHKFLNGISFKPADKGLNGNNKKEIF